MAEISSVLGIKGALTSPVFTYAPTDIEILLYTADSQGDYEHKVHGYAAGTFIQIDRDTPPIETAQVTMDGRTQRKMRLLDSMYTVVITLAQSSISNSQLEQMYYRDINQTDYENSWARQEITISDAKSGMLLGPSKAWIDSLPSVSYADGIETRQWTLKVFGRYQDVRITGNKSEFEFTGALGVAADLAKGPISKFRGV